MPASLNNPTIGPILVNAVDYTAKVKAFWCTDEDLSFGLGKFEITIADKDGTVAANLPAWPSESGLWKQVSITADGNTIFKGLTENIKFQVGTGGNEVVVSGYNLGSELVNMFITKDYTQGSSAMIGPRADLFLKDVLTNAGRTMAFITPASPVVTGGTPPSYPAAGQSPGYIQQKYIHDIVREVLTTIGWAGNIDTVGNLNMFNPLYPANPGVIIPSGVIQSVFPTDTSPASPSANNIKDGNTVRDLHVTKNYLEVRGAGSGYDPSWNGLTANPASWTGASWALSNTDIPAPLAVGPVPPSLIGTPTPAGGLGIFNPVNAEYDFNTTTYGVKGDINTSSYLNFIFNKKTGLHFWVKESATNTQVKPDTLSLVFTDTGGNTASLTSSLVLTNNAWAEQTIPTPMVFYNAWASGQTDPWNYAGAFNFSAITKMVFAFTPAIGAGGFGAVSQIQTVGFNDMYFVCQPFYVPTPLASVDKTYGQRDQVHNAGSQYVNQLDLQAYGDLLPAKYKAPMLRNALTIVTDGTVLQLQNKAGNSLQFEVPRWNYRAPSFIAAGGKSQYWRLLQTRWEYSTRTGLIQKIDCMPSSAI